MYIVNDLGYIKVKIGAWEHVIVPIQSQAISWVKRTNTPRAFGRLSDPTLTITLNPENVLAHVCLTTLLYYYVYVYELILFLFL